MQSHFRLEEWVLVRGGRLRHVRLAGLACAARLSLLRSMDGRSLVLERSDRLVGAVPRRFARAHARAQTLAVNLVRASSTSGRAVDVAAGFCPCCGNVL